MFFLNWYKTKQDIYGSVICHCFKDFTSMERLRQGNLELSSNKPCFKKELSIKMIALYNTLQLHYSSITQTPSVAAAFLGFELSIMSGKSTQLREASMRKRCCCVMNGELWWEAVIWLRVRKMIFQFMSTVTVNKEVFWNSCIIL